jgi:molybdenum cofactor biosynthesis enzyme
MTAASVALLIIYDMAALDKAMVISGVRLLSKAAVSRATGAQNDLG